jgi:hypothetical protein
VAANAVISAVSLSAAPRQRAATISRSNLNHSYAKVIPSPSAPTRFAAEVPAGGLGLLLERDELVRETAGPGRDGQVFL